MPLSLGNWLDTPLDASTIYEKLGEMEYRPMEYDHSEYYMDYADLFEELSLIASSLYLDFERLLRDIDYSWNLPQKSWRQLQEATGIEYPNGAAWFNIASALMDETEMSLLMEEGGFYDPLSEETKRAKRIRALSCLTKEKLTQLFTETYQFLMQYLKLFLTYQAISGLIGELEYHHSFRERKGRTELPPTAYVE